MSAPRLVACPACGFPASVMGGKIVCRHCQDNPPRAVPIAQAQEQQYFVQTATGQSFGPVSKSELDTWAREGRITAGCQVVRDGADEWQWASDLYPFLEPAGQATTAVAQTHVVHHYHEAQPASSNRTLAILLSALVCPGLGQFVLGRPETGVAMLLLWLLGWIGALWTCGITIPLVLAVWIWSVVDAAK